MHICVSFCTLQRTHQPTSHQLTHQHLSYEPLYSTLFYEFQADRGYGDDSGSEEEAPRQPLRKRMNNKRGGLRGLIRRILG